MMGKTIRCMPAQGRSCVSDETDIVVTVTGVRTVITIGVHWNCCAFGKAEGVVPSRTMSIAV
jgi:hypothetical protein